MLIRFNLEFKYLRCRESLYKTYKTYCSESRSNRHQRRDGEIERSRTWLSLSTCETKAAYLLSLLSSESNYKSGLRNTTLNIDRSDRAVVPGPSYYRECLFASFTLLLHFNRKRKAKWINETEMNDKSNEWKAHHTNIFMILLQSSYCLLLPYF